MQETEQLVVAFVQLSKQGGSKVTREDTFKQCQEAQTEVSTHQFHMPLHANIWQCASLRAEVSRLHTQLRDTSKQKEKYHDRLAVAEKRIDRLQSKTLAAINPHQKLDKEEINHESPVETPASPTVSAEAWSILISMYTSLTSNSHLSLHRRMVLLRQTQQSGKSSQRSVRRTSNGCSTRTSNCRRMC